MNKHDRWLNARDECWKRFLVLTDAKASKGRPCTWSDHGRWFTKDGEPVLFDNPYAPSLHLQHEGILIDDGWRALHLPRHMSWYVAEKCQPRLLAPPNSKADLVFLALFLDVAGYEGNFTYTEEYRKRESPEHHVGWTPPIEK